MSQPTFIPLPASQLGGAIAVNVFAILSTLALVSVALRIIWLAIQRYWLHPSTESQEYVFFHTQLGQYAACLLIAMIFNTVAGIIGIPWLFQRGITEGWTCRAQATVMQVGNWAAGYFTVTIAVHTFNSLVLRKRQSVTTCRMTISIGWVASVLAASAPFMFKNPEGFVYGADGLACGVRAIFPKMQFLFHILISSILSALLYSLIFLVLRGTLKINGGIKLTLNPNERWNNSEGLGENYHRFIARVSKSMLWYFIQTYFIAYVALLVPYSVMRLLDISGFTVPFQAMVFAFVCWFSLGVVDVLLLYNTFRVLGPAFDGRSSSNTKREVDSFGTAGHLEKYDDYSSPRGTSAWEEKVNQYRNPSPFSSRSIGGNSSLSTSTISSGQNLLPLHAGFTTDHQSNYSQSNLSVIGRPITPVFDYAYVVTAPFPAASISLRSPDRDLTHVRQASLSSPGLPAAPRRTRSPVISQPIPAPLRGLDALTYIEHEMSRQRSTQTFGHNSPSSKTLSWSSEEVEISDWTSRNPRQETSMSGAVVPAFPNYVFPRTTPQTMGEGMSRSPLGQNSFPMASPPPAARLRPLILSRGSSLDAHDLWSSPSNSRQSPISRAF
ncbi:hypothetical protein B0H34DRAFT_824442 [Crassisporium funariophilum]|nr:hypothetical protein B0H34DRAFT_824442 [Crassisporium funariophilum]